MREYELFSPVKDFLLERLDCEKVYGEIDNLDVLGLCGNVLIGVELKTRLTFKLLDQAVRRKELVDYMYIAFPEPKNGIEMFVLDWCETQGIGIIYADSRSARVYRVAKYNRLRRIRKQNGYKYDIRDHILEYSDQNIGGVPSGEVLTPYKRTIQKVQKYLEQTKEIDLLNGRTDKGYARTRYCKNDKGNIIYNLGKPLKETVYVQNAGDRTIDELLDNVNTHYAQPKQSLVATLKEVWNKDWCEINVYDNKRYYRLRD